MINFNTLLRDEEIDPKVVKLVRHQDTRFPGRPTPYQLWLASDGRLNLYQRIQRRLVFGGARMIATFVATPLNETLFVGVYEVGAGDPPTAGPDVIDPITGQNVSSLHLYDLAQSQKLSEYAGRLVIEWGPGYRSWVQLAKNKEKRIIELRRDAKDPPFSGFMSFREKLSSLAAIPLSWRSTLSAVSGVYLLQDVETGRQYVGSAQGVGGFWGRWEQYVASGHGGNLRMQSLPNADYQVSILEIASSSPDAEDILKMEAKWKEKLLTREFGLNAN